MEQMRWSVSSPVSVLSCISDSLFASRPPTHKVTPTPILPPSTVTSTYDSDRESHRLAAAAGAAEFEAFSGEVSLSASLATPKTWEMPPSAAVLGLSTGEKGRIGGVKLI